MEAGESKRNRRRQQSYVGASDSCHGAGAGMKRSDEGRCRGRALEPFASLASSRVGLALAGLSIPSPCCSSDDYERKEGEGKKKAKKQNPKTKTKWGERVKKTRPVSQSATITCRHQPCLRCRTSSSAGHLDTLRRKRIQKV